ncbi:MAG: Eco29kI family restriction endonuclease [Gammaproteobacteria bacterium]
MPPTKHQLALQAVERAIDEFKATAAEDQTPGGIKRIRKEFEEIANSIDSARAAHDPIRLPRDTFDPADPKVVGRIVSLALLAQPRLPLAEVTEAYGSGVYAIYYEGPHPFYAAISGTETPIYVGKADPAVYDASTSREQGPKLTGRLIEHAGTIATAERYAADPSRGILPICLADFRYRALVCTTNAQLVAEQHLIRTFLPIWNSQTKACWGMSKHGDAATTRANKRSPWDVVHPGRAWALDSRLVDSLSLDEIRARIDQTLARVPPWRDKQKLIDEFLAGFQQSHA